MDQEVIEQGDLRQGAWLETVCAFANGRGGSLLVEVAETRRRKTPLETLERLPVVIYEELGITCDVNLVMVGGRMAVEVTVLPSPQPVSYEGRFFQRRGGQTSLLVGADLVRFLRGRDEEEEAPWERRPVPSARLEDLDADALQALGHAARERTEPTSFPDSDWADEAPAMDGLLAQLGALGLADSATGFLNHAGVLMAHRAPDELIEGALVVVGFFTDDAPGGSTRGPARRLEIRGPLVAQANQVVEAVLSPLPPGVRRVVAAGAAGAAGMTGVTGSAGSAGSAGTLGSEDPARAMGATVAPRVKEGALPPVALREAVLNALTHKDYAAGAPVQVSVYADRVVVSNVGRPPASWTADDLAAPHSARPSNPTVASALAAVGATAGWGRGTQLMNDACAQAGLPAPRFELSVDETAVTLPLVPAPVDPLADLRVTRTDRQVLALLAELDRPTAAHLAATLGVSDSTVRRSLRRLTQLGLIARHGSNKTGFWRVLS